MSNHDHPSPPNPRRIHRVLADINRRGVVGIDRLNHAGTNPEAIMTNEQIEAEFTAAEAEWQAAHPGYSYSSTQHRYFFFAGAEFGLHAAAGIYGEAKPVTDQPTDPDHHHGDPDHLKPDKGGNQAADDYW